MSKEWIFGAAAAVVLGVGAIGGAFYLSQTSKTSQQIGASAADRRVAAPSPSTTTFVAFDQAAVPVTSSLTTVPLADWKTYTKDSAGYTFKYPSDWTVATASDGCGPAFYPPGTKKVWVNVCGLYTNFDEAPLDMASRSIGSNLSSLVSRSETVVGGHSAIDQQLKLSSEQSNEEVYVGDVKAKNGSKGTLAVYLYVQDLTQEAQSRDTFGLILQTFQFPY